MNTRADQQFRKTLRDSVSLYLISLRALTNHLGLIKRSKERPLVHKLASKLAVKTANLREPMIRLSGGNQQKVVIGKWLARNPSIFLFCHSTRGVDYRGEGRDLRNCPETGFRSERGHLLLNRARRIGITL
jgi:ABC-type sugar transport system ATPase subunit